MKKKIRKIIFYLRIWFIQRMGYKLPSLREVSPVVPDELYDHFGYIVHTKHRTTKSQDTCFTELGEIPERCLSCDLYKNGIPCTFNHRMANGKDICDDYEIEIICKNTGNI